MNKFFINFTETSTLVLCFKSITFVEWTHGTECATKRCKRQINHIPGNNRDPVLLFLRTSS